MSKLTGNKGEWSEIYVFLRLLEIGKLYAATENLERKDSVFYDILKIIRNETLGVLEFVYNKESCTITLFKKGENQPILSLDAASFKKEADKLYEEIVSSKGSSFSIPDTENFLNQLKITTLKAKSSDKSDICIKIHDINTGYNAKQGFSIKSRLGASSTLINAGRTTNFIYQVIGNITPENINDFNNLNKFHDKFDLLNNIKCKLKYVGMENQVFKNNLILIDSDLPQMLANVLKQYYCNGTSVLSQAVNEVEKENPLKYDLDCGQPFYTYKIKKMLMECAVGMTPAKIWSGTFDATGGYIIVREDGEVLCYHLFNKNDFENYLFKNTKLETPSTSRHDFGKIYKDGENYFIKLNLQVRFIK